MPPDKNVEELVKSCISLVLFAALLSSVTAFGQSTDHDGCTNATLTGDYAFRVSGAILPSVPPGTPRIQIPRDGVAMTRFDGLTVGPSGVGGLSQVDFVMSSGTPLVGLSDPVSGFHTGETGWYKVFRDCTGMAEIHFPTPKGGTSGAVIDLMFVLSNHGNTIHTIVSQLIPPNTKTPVPVSIHSDGEKMGGD